MRSSGSLGTLISEMSSSKNLRGAKVENNVITFSQFFPSSVHIIKISPLTDSVETEEELD